MKIKNDNLKDITKFEFLLTIDDNIICQRYFNVRKYNPQTRDSIDVYDTMSYITTELEEDLVKKSIEKLYDEYNPYRFKKDSDDKLTNEDKPNLWDEKFHLILKLNGSEVYHKILPAGIYPPKVRYTVDIRPIIPRILNELSDTLSRKKLSYY